MTDEVLTKISKLVMDYICREYDSLLAKEIIQLMESLTKITFSTVVSDEVSVSYDNLQRELATINEVNSKRKQKGMFYTPCDVVNYIIRWTVGIHADETDVRKFFSNDFENVDLQQFCYKETVFDPTCGTGEFLLPFLDLKFKVLEKKGVRITSTVVSKVLKTIFGNDINNDSIQILKLRILLYLLHSYGIRALGKIKDALKDNFTVRDFVTGKLDYVKFDYIVGNPPYVEDGVSQLDIREHYGNIYANVLVNAAKLLKPNGVFGFIVPLSYVATPRMKVLRNRISALVSKQYIMSYADRPDCLFSQVHQKLCILWGKSNEKHKKNVVYTGNYQYWYKEERQKLFDKVQIIKNDFVTTDYIPKLGNTMDKCLYKKITENGDLLSNILDSGCNYVYVNMRAAFWIKAFLGEHKNGEYKKFGCASREMATYIFCLLNSSLFWWYWICISDCWHITGKELKNFYVRHIDNFNTLVKLSKQLENKLEDTKVYIGTKQTEYAYKHKDCVDVIHKIDDEIAKIYGLTQKENEYVKNFAYRYRISGGVSS